MISIKTPRDIEAMRKSGSILAQVLELVRIEAKPGLTPQDMSKIAHDETLRLGGTSPFRGVPGPPDFPDIICISVNDAVQHSIPTNIPFKSGDIVNFDYGVTYDGMITDSGITVCIGEYIDADSKRLVEGTQKALNNALKVVKEGCRVGDISAVIQETLTRYRLGIVKELAGHGVGYELHEAPDILNYGRAGTGPTLKAGMTIAIEPISTLGSPDIYEDHDGWTLKTEDGSWSAQFEHTVLVTKNGCEILTKV